LTLIFDRERVDRAVIERWAGDLATLLEQVPVHLSSSIFAIEPLLSPSMRVVHTSKKLRVEAQNFTPPQTAMERRIASVWQRMFGFERVSVDENFFDLGASSLALVRLHSQLRHELGLDFPIVALLEHPTIRSLSSRLSQSQNGAAQKEQELRD